MIVEEAPPGGAEHFGKDVWEKLQKFADMLCMEGEKRGLIGPREYEKLWTRHILNSTAVLDFVDEGVRLADIGSGAGFPGLVVAIVRPDVQVTLIDSMDRRCAWLRDAKEGLELKNVSVRYSRAEDLKGNFQTDIVTARAVASLAKLIPLAMPIIRGGGTLLALKGEKANEEIDAAIPQLQQYRAKYADVHTLKPFGCDEITRVVEIKKK